MIKILPTDTAFPDSPDAGPDCLCSRCGKGIDNDVPIHIWVPEVTQPDGVVEKLGPISQEDTPRTYNYKFLEIGTYTVVLTEYRYHPACLGLGHNV